MKLSNILNYDLEPHLEVYFNKICDFVDSLKEKEQENKKRQKLVKQVETLLPYFLTLEEEGFKVEDAALEHDFVEHGIVSYLFGMPTLTFGAETMSQYDEHNKYIEGLADLVSFYLQSEGKKKPSRVFGNMLTEDDINHYWALLEESEALHYLELYNLLASDPGEGWELINHARYYEDDYNLAIAL